MKTTPRTILIAGILTCLAAAWSGFWVGGGFRPAEIKEVAAAVRMESPREVQPVSHPAPAARGRESHARFTGASSAKEFAPENKPSISTTSSNATIATVSLDEPAAGSAVSPPANRRRPRVATAEETQPHYPLVMLDLPPAVLSAQPGLTAAVANLRDKFIADIGGMQQNPADPAYLNRWTQGVASSDDQLRAAIGWQAFNELAAAAYQAKMAAH